MAKKKKQLKKIELQDFKVIRRLLAESIPQRWKLYALSLVFMVSVAGFTSALPIPPS